MHTREETDVVNTETISRVVCKISELNDSLLGISLSDKNRDYALADFHTAIEDAICDLCEKFNGEI